jgi:outer membrane protein OmpA-like peptidoglycan-associated protein
MGDVLFDTGSFTLRQLAREKLARLAGIVLNYPGLKLEAEGHTDNVGGEAFNQRLSEQRAGAVRDYPALAGIPADQIVEARPSPGRSPTTRPRPVASRIAGSN